MWSYSLSLPPSLHSGMGNSSLRYGTSQRVQLRYVISSCQSSASCGTTSSVCRRTPRYTASDVQTFACNLRADSSCPVVDPCSCSHSVVSQYCSRRNKAILQQNAFKLIMFYRDTQSPIEGIAKRQKVLEKKKKKNLFITNTHTSYKHIHTSNRKLIHVSDGLPEKQ